MKKDERDGERERERESRDGMELGSVPIFQLGTVSRANAHSVIPRDEGGEGGQAHAVPPRIISRYSFFPSLSVFSGGLSSFFPPRVRPSPLHHNGRTAAAADRGRGGRGGTVSEGERGSEEEEVGLLPSAQKC